MVNVRVLVPMALPGEGVEVIRPQDGRPVGYDIGHALRNAMSVVGPDEWGCFIDPDIMFTTRVWFKQIHEAIDKKPDAGMFTCVASRLSRDVSAWQMGTIDDEFATDVICHWRKGRQEAAEGIRLLDVTDIESTGQAPTSTMLAVIKGATWKGLSPVPSVYAVDYWLHRELKKRGKRIFLIRGLYVFHAFGMDKRLLDPDE